MRKSIPGSIWRSLNSRWLYIFFGGLAGISAIQRRRWRQDKTCLVRAQSVPLPPPLDEWPHLPKVSALVAAWNESGYIDRHIQSFLSLPYPRKELVLVAGGEDGTYALAKRYVGDQVKVLVQHPGEGKQRALRRGFDLAGGEIIYLADADCRFDETSFEAAIWPIAAGAEQAASGTSQPYPEDLGDPFIVSQAASHIYAAYHAGEYAPGLLGRNCAVARDLLAESGGLALPAPTGTDYVLAKALVRSGAQIRQVPYSRVSSRYPRRRRDYVRQQHRFMWNVWFYGLRSQAPAESRSILVNSLVGLGMLLLPLLALIGGSFLWAVWGLLLAYASLSRLRYLRFIEKLLDFRAHKLAWLGAPLFLLLDFAIWAGLLPQLLKQQRKW